MRRRSTSPIPPQPNLGPNGLKRGPMASSMAQWLQAWPNGLKRGPMASSVAQGLQAWPKTWPQVWPNGLKRCTSSCGGGVSSSGGGTSQREELPGPAHSSVQSPGVCARPRGKKVTSKVMSDVTLVYRYFIHSKIKIFLTLTEHHAGAAGFHCFHCFALTARAAAVIDLIMEKVLSSTACGQETWQQKKRMACAKMSKD